MYLNIMYDNKYLNLNVTDEDDPDIVRIFDEHFSTVGRRLEDFHRSNLSAHAIPTDYLSNFLTQN